MHIPRCSYVIVFCTSAIGLSATFGNEWALINIPSNAPHPELEIGQVDYEFYIAKYETTATQFAEFMNSVDPDGDEADGIFDMVTNLDVIGNATILFDNEAPAGRKYIVKPYFRNKPVNQINIANAMRYCNWLHSNKDPSGIDAGAYDLSSGIPQSRSPGARYFLPTVDEWAKAAYFDPAAGDRWWDYATRSDAPPAFALANAAGHVVNPGPNVANYDEQANWGGSTFGQVTTVGGCSSRSFFGTYDQSGNVRELSESTSPMGDFLVLGGSLRSNALQLAALPIATNPPGAAPTRTMGFRVARPRSFSVDVNNDGLANGLDIQDYVDCLVNNGPNCPCSLASFVSALIDGSDCD